MGAWPRNFRGHDQTVRSVSQGIGHQERIAADNVELCICQSGAIASVEYILESDRRDLFIENKSVLICSVLAPAMKWIVVVVRSRAHLIPILGRDFYGAC